MSEFYVLNASGEAEAVAGVEEWTNWFRDNPDARRVGRTSVGEAEVSTVFLGMNHRWGPGEPLLFETMIFEGEWNEYQWRWSTREQAVAGHDRIVAALRDGKSPEDAVAS